jgi:hypothetical protein
MRIGIAAGEPRDRRRRGPEASPDPRLPARRLVGAISMARAIDDSDLSQLILSNAAVALKERTQPPTETDR